MIDGALLSKPGQERIKFNQRTESFFKAQKRQ